MNIVKLVEGLESRVDKFHEYNKAAPNQLDFEQECLYARQILMANNYLCGFAQENQMSLIDAIYNVASTGISLNPARSHAYLVPRKVGQVKKVCLDISYRGLLKLATDTGVTKYMKAELIYQNDDFKYNGFDQRPHISCNPFKDRGEFIGVYAMAVLHDGSVLVEMMSADEVYKIRDDSEAYKSAKKKGGWSLESNVWVKYEGEMVKKTVLKRAFKTLPETKGKNALDKAVDVINEHEGIEFNTPTQDYTADESQAYSMALDSSDYVGLLCLRDAIGYEASNQLFKLHEEPRMEKGGKGRYDKQMQENIKVARDLREDNLALVISMCDQGDTEGLDEMMSECNQWEREYYRDKMPNGMLLPTTKAA